MNAGFYISRMPVLAALLHTGVMNAAGEKDKDNKTNVAVTQKSLDENQTSPLINRLTLGGYGEAVYSRNFYSDNMFRYSHGVA